VPKEERQRMVLEAARMLDLEEFLDRKPKALSGGQRQRVAMGRAIVRQPKVFCMDEPLSNLDAKLRVQTRTQIAELQRRLAVTTVYVTHDQVEAMTMGDRVAVLKDGHLQQCDTPLRLYERPANVFVAGFIGSPGMNLGTFEIDDGAVHLDGTRFPLTRPSMEALGREGADSVILGFRPESVEVVGDGEGFPLHVTVVEELGSDAFAYGTIEPPGDDPMAVVGRQVIAKVDPRHPPAKGQRISLRIREGEALMFSNRTGERLPS
jgi:multiple sugar transport system ATP-binding protein